MNEKHLSAVHLLPLQRIEIAEDDDEVVDENRDDVDIVAERVCENDHVVQGEELDDVDDDAAAELQKR